MDVFQAEDRELTEAELASISFHLVDWPRKARDLGLSEGEIDNIKYDHSTTEQQKSAMMRRWKQIYCDRATLKELLEVAEWKGWERHFVHNVMRELGHYSNKGQTLYKVCSINLNRIASWCQSIALVALIILFIALILYHPTTTYYIHKENTQCPPTYLTSHFVGREIETSDIFEFLNFETQECRIVNLYGSPGFGKSTVAVHIGHRMLAKGINVIYIDLQESNREPIKMLLAKKILKCVDYAQHDVVTFEKMLQWARTRYFYHLIILDNCDDVLHYQKDDLQSAIEMIIERSSVIKVLMTSRLITLHGSDFKLYKINNLTTLAAIELLSHKIPSRAFLTKSEKDELVMLSGNVPLAIKVIGALLHLPTSTPQGIITRLKQQRITTLSPEHLQPKVRIDSCINLSYEYLSMSQQEIGKLLSTFPGSFTIEASVTILEGIVAYNFSQTIIVEALTVLVQRSLLELDHNGRYRFHCLIREYFILKLKWSIHSSDEIEFKFQSFYYHLLDNISSDYSNNLFKESIMILDIERHNFLKVFYDLQNNRIMGCCSAGSLSFLSHYEKCCLLPVALKVSAKSIDNWLLRNKFSDEFLQNLSQSCILYFDDVPLKNLKPDLRDTYLILLYHVIALEKNVHSLESALESFNLFKPKFDSLKFNIGFNVSSYIRILHLMTQIYSKLEYHDAFKNYYFTWIEYSQKKKVINCVPKSCSYYHFGLYHLQKGEDEKAMAFFNLSAVVDCRTCICCSLNALIAYLGVCMKTKARSDVDLLCDGIEPLVIEVVELPHSEIIQKITVIENVMFQILKCEQITKKKYRRVKDIIKKLIYTLYKGPQLNNADNNLYPNRVSQLLLSLYLCEDYELVEELGTEAKYRILENEKSWQISDLAIESVIALAKYQSGKDFFPANLLNTACLLNLRICSISSKPAMFYDDVIDGLKALSYKIFVIPLDTYSAINSSSQRSSYFRELTYYKQTSSKDIGPVLSLPETVARPVIRYIEGRVKVLMQSLLQYTILRFLVNFLSVLLRLDMAVFLLQICNFLCYIFFSIVVSSILYIGKKLKVQLMLSTVYYILLFNIPYFMGLWWYCMHFMYELHKAYQCFFQYHWIIHPIRLQVFMTTSCTSYIFGFCMGYMNISVNATTLFAFIFHLFLYPVLYYSFSSYG